MEKYPNIKKYLTYSELFYIKGAFNKTSILEYIKTKDGFFWLVGLSALSRLPFNELDKLKPDFETFLKTLKKPFNKDALYTSVPVSQQTIMTSMKWIITHASFNLSIAPEIKNKTKLINECIYLCAMLGDSLESHINRSTDFNTFLENIAPEVQRNAYVNSIVNRQLFPSVIRSLIYFKDLIQSSILKNEPDYLNCEKDFSEHFGYSVEEYIASIMSMVSSGNKPFSFYTNFYDFYIKKIENPSFNYPTIKKVLQNLTINITDAKDKLCQTYVKNWELSFFWQYGFLQLSPTILLPLNLSVISHNIFLSLKFEIQKIYPEHSSLRNNYLSFYGKLQEKYLIRLFQETTKDLPYVSVIPEFSYHGNKSPDILMTVGKRTLLVFESKGYSLKKHSLFSNDDSALIQDELHLSVEPIKQILDRLDELQFFNNVNEQVPINLSQFNKIFIFSVTAEGIPLNSYNQEKIVQELNIYVTHSILHKKIKGFFHFGVEELEMFLSWFFLSKSKKNPSTKLRDLLVSKKSLNDFIYYHNENIPMLPFFKKRSHLIISTINTILTTESQLPITKTKT